MQGRISVDQAMPAGPALRWVSLRRAIQLFEWAQSQLEPKLTFLDRIA
jgi:hypothetical protein